MKIKTIFLFTSFLITTKVTFSQDDYFDQISVKVSTTSIDQYHITTANYKDKYCIGIETSSVAVIDLNSKEIIRTVKFNNNKVFLSFFGSNDSILITYFCNDSIEVYNWINEKSVCKFKASIPCSSSKMTQKQVEKSPQKKFLFQHYAGFPLFILNTQNGKRFPQKFDEELTEHDLYFDEEYNICFLNTFSGYGNRLLNLNDNKPFYEYNLNEDWFINGYYKPTSSKIIQVLCKMSQYRKKQNEIFDEKILKDFREENEWANYDTFKIKLWDFKSKIYNKTIKTVVTKDTIFYCGLSNNTKKAIFYSYSQKDFDAAYIKFYYYDLEKGKSLRNVKLEYLKTSRFNDFTLLDSLISFVDTSNTLNIFSISQNKIIYSFKNVVYYKINNGLIGIVDSNETFTLLNPQNLEVICTKKTENKTFLFSRDGTLIFFIEKENNSKTFNKELYSYELVNKIVSIFKVATKKEVVF